MGGPWKCGLLLRTQRHQMDNAVESYCNLDGRAGNDSRGQIFAMAPNCNVSLDAILLLRLSPQSAGTKRKLPCYMIFSGAQLCLSSEQLHHSQIEKRDKAHQPAGKPEHDPRSSHPDRRQQRHTVHRKPYILAVLSRKHLNRDGDRDTEAGQKLAP